MAVQNEGIERPHVVVRELAPKLGLLGIAGIIFFSVSGGPYGLEDTVGESGPGMAILLILVTPLIWSLPTALMVAELATAMPVQGGYYYWTKTALGPFWGFNQAWWMWLTSWVDLALYPVLFVDYAAYFFPILQEDQLIRWLVATAMIWTLTWVNIRGAKIVGDSSKLFFLVVITPFILVTILGLFQLKGNPIEPFTFAGTGWPAAFGAGLFVIMWNYMGWDGLSTVAGEIENPRRDYPRALALTIPIITIIYLLPTLVSLSVVGATDVEWTAGAYNVVAERVGGPWLGTLLTVTAVISAVGLFSAWLLQNSRIPYALAQDGYLPEAITRPHKRFGTPTVAIIIQAVICSIFALSVFSSLVAIDVTIYSFALMLEFASLIALRIKQPHMKRPFRVPGGWPGIVVITVLPLAVIVTAIYYQVLDVGWVQGIGWAAVGLATGPIAYLVLRPFKQRRGIDHQIEFAMGEPALATTEVRV